MLLIHTVNGRVGYVGGSVSPLIKQHFSTVKTFDIMHRKICYGACKGDCIATSASDISDGNAVSLVRRRMAGTVHMVITDSDTINASVHMRRIFGGVKNAVYQNIVQFCAALIQQPDIGAESGGSNIPNLDAADVSGKICHRKMLFKPSTESGQCDGIIFGKSSDVFDYDIMTTLSEIDAISVFDQHFGILLAE